MSVDPQLVVAGALVGLVVGLTGVGGGALMTPALVLIFGVAPITAVGTDLWFAALTKIAASRVHYRRGLIDGEVARRLWAGSLPGAAIALLWLHLWGSGAPSGTVLRFAIGIAVLVTALGLLVQPKLLALVAGRSADPKRPPAAFQKAATIAAGAFVGAVVATTSVGAGALGAVLLAGLYPVRLTPPRLIATDIVHAIPLALFAGVGHLSFGSVDLGLLAQLLLGSVPAAALGALLCAHAPHSVLRAALCAALMAAGIKLLSPGQA